MEKHIYKAPETETVELINEGGDQVYFSKGNLRYTSGAWYGTTYPTS